MLCFVIKKIKIPKFKYFQKIKKLSFLRSVLLNIWFCSKIVPMKLLQNKCFLVTYINEFVITVVVVVVSSSTSSSNTTTLVITTVVVVVVSSSTTSTTTYYYYYSSNYYCSSNTILTPEFIILTLTNAQHPGRCFDNSHNIIWI